MTLLSVEERCSFDSVEDPRHFFGTDPDSRISTTDSGSRFGLDTDFHFASVGRDPDPSSVPLTYGSELLHWRREK